MIDSATIMTLTVLSSACIFHEVVTRLAYNSFSSTPQLTTDDSAMTPARESLRGRDGFLTATRMQDLCV